MDIKNILEWILAGVIAFILHVLPRAMVIAFATMFLLTLVNYG